MTVTQWLTDKHGIHATPGRNQPCPQCGKPSFQIDKENQWARCRSCPFGIDFISRKSVRIRQLLGPEATVITLEDVDLARAERKEQGRSKWSAKKLEAAQNWTPLVEVWEVVKQSYWPAPLRFTAICIAFALDRKTGYGWITEADIARATGYALSTIQDNVKLLTEGGEIVMKVPRPYKDKKGKVRYGSDKVLDKVEKLFQKGSRHSPSGRTVNSYTLIRRAWRETPKNDEEE